MSVARITRETFTVTAAARRERDDALRRVLAAAPVQPVVTAEATYRVAFARVRAACAVCGRGVNAGSYRPRIYIGDAHADLCLPCARTYASPRLVRFAARTIDGRKRAG